ncbi:MAG TPA: hypothetical protein PLV68_05475 [Ilumatobacteraceae bacterium]|nr:hypothetical protein [Ilumatobacteraceae bacterium]
MWAIVEIMGRRTRAGMCSDASIGGAQLLRVEHPTRRDHTGEEPVVEYYAPQAIFAIRPCSQDEATQVAAWAWPERPSTPALSGPAADLVDTEDDDDDDDEVPF